MQVIGKIFMLLALSVFLFGTCQAETVDKIVATVNGEIILLSELKERMAAIDKAAPDYKAADAREQAARELQVLHGIIQERLAEAEVRRLKISVSNSELDSGIQTIKEQNKLTDEQLAYQIKEAGKTLDQFREEIRKQMERSRLVDRVLKSKIVVTDQQIDAYLKSESAVNADSRRLAIIFLPSESPTGKEAEAAEKQAQEIHGRIKAGADFAQMAREYSKGPAAQEGGDIGFIAEDELSPSMKKVVSDLKPNDMSNVVKGAGGYYIVKLLDVRKENKDAADDATRQKIRRELLQKELSSKYAEWLQELESRAFIQISL
ncbi:MAG: peptidylprolyl isomerase [Syntrophobacteraceae bacterium]